MLLKMVCMFRQLFVVEDSRTLGCQVEDLFSCQIERRQFKMLTTECQPLAHAASVATFEIERKRLGLHPTEPLTLWERDNSVASAVAYRN